MLSDAQQNELTRHLRVIRTIVGALVAGIVVFAVVAVVVGGSRPSDDPILTMVALLFSVGSVVAAALVPRVVTKTALRSAAHHDSHDSKASPPSVAAEVGDVGPIAKVFQTRLLIACAILDGAAFFNLIAYMLEGQMLSMAVAIVLLLLILIQFPSRIRLEDWVTHELRRVKP